MEGSQYAKCCDSALYSKLLQQDWFRRRRRGINKLEINQARLEESRDNPTKDQGDKRGGVLKSHLLQNQTCNNSRHASGGDTKNGKVELLHLDVYLKENYFMFE